MYLLRTVTPIDGSIEYSEHETLAKAQKAQTSIISMIEEGKRPMTHDMLSLITIWHCVQEGECPDTETT